MEMYFIIAAAFYLLGWITGRAINARRLWEHRTEELKAENSALEDLMRANAAITAYADELEEHLEELRGTVDALTERLQSVAPHSEH